MLGERKFLSIASCLAVILMLNQPSGRYRGVIAFGLVGCKW